MIKRAVLKNPCRANAPDKLSPLQAFFSLLRVSIVRTPRTKDQEHYLLKILKRAIGKEILRKAQIIKIVEKLQEGTYNQFYRGSLWVESFEETKESLRALYAILRFLDS